jgi:hypothetical protein
MPSSGVSLASGENFFSLNGNGPSGTKFPRLSFHGYLTNMCASVHSLYSGTNIVARIRTNGVTSAALIATMTGTGGDTYNCDMTGFLPVGMTNVVLLSLSNTAAGAYLAFNVEVSVQGINQ